MTGKKKRKPAKRPRRAGRRPRIPPSCGAKCLAYVAGRLGIGTDAKAVAAVSDDAPGMASMAGLARAAEKLGLAARPVHWALGDLAGKGTESAGRAILHFPPEDDGHFMVFEEFSDGVCYASDHTFKPQVVKLPLAKMRRWWAGKVLVVGESATPRTAKRKGPSKGGKKKAAKAGAGKPKARPSKTKRKKK